MLKLAIYEDDVIQCEQIQCLTQSSLQIPFEFDIFSYAKGFLERIANKKCPYQIVLMDIELGSGYMSGINLAKKINSANPNTQIIFINQHLKYASSVYETNHVYFVYKQQMTEYLPKALSATCQKLYNLCEKIQNLLEQLKPDFCVWMIRWYLNLTQNLKMFQNCLTISHTTVPTI